MAEELVGKGEDSKSPIDNASVNVPKHKDILPQSS